MWCHAAHAVPLLRPDARLAGSRAGLRELGAGLRPASVAQGAPHGLLRRHPRHQLREEVGAGSRGLPGEQLHPQLRTQGTVMNTGGGRPLRIVPRARCWVSRLQRPPARTLRALHAYLYTVSADRAAGKLSVVLTDRCQCTRVLAPPELPQGSKTWRSARETHSVDCRPVGSRAGPSWRCSDTLAPHGGSVSPHHPRSSAFSLVCAPRADGGGPLRSLRRGHGHARGGARAHEARETLHASERLRCGAFVPSDCCSPTRKLYRRRG